MSCARFDFQVADIVVKFACDAASDCRGGYATQQPEDQADHPGASGYEGRVLGQGYWRCKQSKSLSLILTVERRPHDGHSHRICLQRSFRGHTQSH
jgi:hypothetical protein